MQSLTPERAFIFRITHVNNMPWILRNGIHCKNSSVRDPNFVNIGNAELIVKRNARRMPFDYTRTLSDYIPFYFTPKSPMMYNIRTGYGGITQRRNSEIAIMVTSLPKLQEVGSEFVYSDRHAYLTAATFQSDLADVGCVDWELLQRSDFRRDPEDPEKVERYQAEALIYRHLPVENLLGIAACNNQVRGRIADMVQDAHKEVPVAVRTAWYFS
jgi:hypothetical protein